MPNIDAVPVGYGSRIHRRGGRRGPGVPGAALDVALMSLLAECDMPLSAYELAARLPDRGFSLPPASVYRALGRLIARELVQKVETLSAYRARDKAKAVLMICTGCGRTTSLSIPDEHDTVVTSMAARGFAATQFALEAIGRCDDCKSEDENEASVTP